MFYVVLFFYLLLFCGVLLMRLSYVFSFILLFSFFISAAEFSELFSADELQIDADELSHDLASGDVFATGNVVVTYGLIQLRASKASINQQTYDFTAQGDAQNEVNISIAEQGSWSAPAVQGNFQKRSVAFGPFRLNSEIWHAAGESGITDESGKKVLQKAWLSTCDLEHPHYRIEAKEIVHHSDQRFTAKHVVLKFGPVPVFYFPLLFGSTNVDQAGLIFRPGYSGRRGAYLQVGRIWKGDILGTSKLYLDLMSKRGIGAGFENNYEAQDREVKTQFYAIHDKKPSETSSGYNRRFRIKKDRFRANAYYRQVIEDDLSLRLNIDYLSDSAMLEDWFKRDHRRYQQAKSFVDLSYDHDYFNLQLNARPRVNTFYTVVEQLPELKLTIPKTSIMDSPLLYDSENSLGYYSLKWRNNQRKRSEFIPWEAYQEAIHQDPSDYQSFRADSLHTLSLPMDFQDIIKITPRASFRVTSYSKSSSRRMTKENLADLIAADNPDDPYNLFPSVNYDDKGGSLNRFASEFGVEFRSKFFSDWQNLEIKAFNIEDIRHIVEPYLNYTYAPEPSKNRDKIYFFDEIDRLQKQHFIRLGIDQRWQSRRDGELFTLLKLQSYLDIHFDRGEESERYWGDFANRLEFSPRKDLSSWVTLLHDVGEGDIQRAEFGLRYGEEEKFNTSLKYIYRNQHFSRSTYSMGSNLADFTGESAYIKKYFESADTAVAEFFIPIDSKTSAELYFEYDLEKKRIAEHSYRVSRQLHCWTMVFGMGWDNNKFKTMIMFHLTAFPKVKIDLDI